MEGTDTISPLNPQVWTQGAAGSVLEDNSMSSGGASPSTVRARASADQSDADTSQGLRSRSGLPSLPEKQTVS